MSYNLTSKTSVARLSWVSVAALTLAMLAPLLIGTHNVSADTASDRSIDIETSDISGAGQDGTDVQYTVSFDAEFAGDSATNIEGLLLIACSDSPIIGDTCTPPSDFDWNATASQVNTQAGITDWDTDTGNSTANVLVLSRAAAASVTDGTTISFVIGNETGDGVTNPSTVGSYYVRIQSYATDALTTGTALTPTTPGSPDTEGGIALSTAEQITIEARVQERLTFCVGIVSTADACGTVSGTLVDLGVLDGASVAEASSEGVTEGTGTAKVQTTTNAANGVSISYFGDDLKVTGATCGAGDIEVAPSFVDQCLNYDSDPNAGTYTTMLGSREQWGVTIVDIAQRPGTVGNGDGGDTSALTADAVYDDTSVGAGGTGTNFAFAGSNTSDVLATSTGVVSSEQLEIDVAAAASITTPTGLYTTTLTFVATSTF